MRRLVAMVTLVALAGCAPSTKMLVEDHHAREALCALGSIDSDEDRLVRESLVRDLAPRVQISQVDVVDVGHADIRAVTLRVATNAIPIDELRIRAVPSSKELVPWELHSLIDVTGEKLPSSRTVARSDVEEISLFMLAVITLGAVRIKPSQSFEVYPSREEIRRSAPRASALAELLTTECARPESGGVAARCTFAFAVRPGAPSPPAVDLVIELSASAEKRETCKMERSFRVPLDPPSDVFRPLR